MDFFYSFYYSFDTIVVITLFTKILLRFTMSYSLFRLFTLLLLLIFHNVESSELNTNNLPYSSLSPFDQSAFYVPGVSDLFADKSLAFHRKLYGVYSVLSKIALFGGASFVAWKYYSLLQSNKNKMAEGVGEAEGLKKSFGSLEEEFKKIKEEREGGLKKREEELKTKEEKLSQDQAQHLKELEESYKKIFDERVQGLNKTAEDLAGLKKELEEKNGQLQKENITFLDQKIEQVEKYKQEFVEENNRLSEKLKSENEKAKNALLSEIETKKNDLKETCTALTNEVKEIKNNFNSENKALKEELTKEIDNYKAGLEEKNQTLKNELNETNEQHKKDLVGSNEKYKQALEESNTVLTKTITEQSESYSKLCKEINESFEKLKKKEVPDEIKKQIQELVNPLLEKNTSANNEILAKIGEANKDFEQKQKEIEEAKSNIEKEKEAFNRLSEEKEKSLRAVAKQLSETHKVDFKEQKEALEKIKTEIEEYVASYKEIQEKEATRRQEEQEKKNNLIQQAREVSEIIVKETERISNNENGGKYFEESYDKLHKFTLWNLPKNLLSDYRKDLPEIYENDIAKNIIDSALGQLTQAVEGEKSKRISDPSRRSGYAALAEKIKEVLEKVTEEITLLEKEEGLTYDENKNIEGYLFSFKEKLKDTSFNNEDAYRKVFQVLGRSFDNSVVLFLDLQEKSTIERFLSLLKKESKLREKDGSRAYAYLLSDEGVKKKIELLAESISKLSEKLSEEGSGIFERFEGAMSTFQGDNFSSESLLKGCLQAELLERGALPEKVSEETLSVLLRGAFQEFYQKYDAEKKLRVHNPQRHVLYVENKDAIKNFFNELDEFVKRFESVKLDNLKSITLTREDEELFNVLSQSSVFTKENGIKGLFVYFCQLKNIIFGDTFAYIIFDFLSASDKSLLQKACSILQEEFSLRKSEPWRSKVFSIKEHNYVEKVIALRSKIKEKTEKIAKYECNKEYDQAFLSLIGMSDDALIKEIFKELEGDISFDDNFCLFVKKELQELKKSLQEEKKERLKSQERSCFYKENKTDIEKTIELFRDASGVFGKSDMCPSEKHNKVFETLNTSHIDFSECDKNYSQEILEAVFSRLLEKENAALIYHSLSHDQKNCIKNFVRQFVAEKELRKVLPSRALGEEKKKELEKFYAWLEEEYVRITKENLSLLDKKRYKNSYDFSFLQVDFVSAFTRKYKKENNFNDDIKFFIDDSYRQKMNLMKALLLLFEADIAKNQERLAQEERLAKRLIKPSDFFGEHSGDIAYVTRDIELSNKLNQIESEKKEKVLTKDQEIQSLQNAKEDSIKVLDEKKVSDIDKLKGYYDIVKEKIEAQELPEKSWSQYVYEFFRNEKSCDALFKKKGVIVKKFISFFSSFKEKFDLKNDAHELCSKFIKGEKLNIKITDESFLEDFFSQWIYNYYSKNKKSNSLIDLCLLADSENIPEDINKEFENICQFLEQLFLINNSEKIFKNLYKKSLRKLLDTTTVQLGGVKKDNAVVKAVIELKVDDGESFSNFLKELVSLEKEKGSSQRKFSIENYQKITNSFKSNDNFIFDFFNSQNDLKDAYAKYSELLNVEKTSCSSIPQRLGEVHKKIESEKFSYSFNKVDTSHFSEFITFFDQQFGDRKEMFSALHNFFNYGSSIVKNESSKGLSYKISSFSELKNYLEDIKVLDKENGCAKMYSLFFENRMSMSLVSSSYNDYSTKIKSNFTVDEKNKREYYKGSIDEIKSKYNESIKELDRSLEDTNKEIKSSNDGSIISQVTLKKIGDSFLRNSCLIALKEGFKKYTQGYSSEQFRYDVNKVSGQEFNEWKDKNYTNMLDENISLDDLIEQASSIKEDKKYLLYYLLVRTSDDYSTELKSDLDGLYNKFMQLSSRLEKDIEQRLSSNKYWLLAGPPGTGKTMAFTAALMKAMCSLKESNRKKLDKLCIFFEVAHSKYGSKERGENTLEKDLIAIAEQYGVTVICRYDEVDECIKVELSNKTGGEVKTEGANNFIGTLDELNTALLLLTTNLPQDNRSKAINRRVEPVEFEGFDESGVKAYANALTTKLEKDKKIIESLSNDQSNKDQVFLLEGQIKKLKSVDTGLIFNKIAPEHSKKESLKVPISSIAKEFEKLISTKAD
jgi:hypothetical protein